MPNPDEIHSLLKAYNPSTPEEKTHLQAMIDLVEGKSPAFSRDAFHPGHFTASAFILSPNEGSLLLIYHGKLHRWLQPGGHVEDSDATLFDAARREVEEETGKTDLTQIGGLFDLDVHTIPARKGDPAHSHFDVRVLFKVQNWDFEAGSDAKDARWVPLGEISEVESDSSVMRAVGKLLKSKA